VNDAPLVSCVMPTRDRSAFVPLAVECFLRQDHPRVELIIVDDGDDPVADLIPDHPAIRYEHSSPRLTLGAKRNLACDRAAGEVIVHWDDDDWSAPRRVSYQLHRLLESAADITGLSDLLFFEAASGRAWRYAYPPGAERSWVAGGTLCYRRAVWERHGFPEIDVGEDTRFLWSGRRLRIAPVEDNGIYVATMHAANTSVKRPAGQRWTEIDGAAVERLLGDDADAYRVAAGGPAKQPDEHVTISVPYFRCRAHIRQCVESLLAQTHRDLTLVVVNDGDPDPPWDLLDDLDDPRLVRFDLTGNRGRYFADQVVLEATRSAYLMIHDADDWSEPKRIAALLERLIEDDGVLALSAARRHEADGTPRHVVQLAHPGRPLGPRFEHRAHQVGLFRVEAVRAVGGFYAGFTIGYDTFLVNALAMIGRIVVDPSPLYHWRMRADSLTNSPATGLRSRRRLEARTELNQMYRGAFGAYCAHRAGRLSADSLAAEIRRLVRARVPREKERELLEYAGRLGALRARPAAQAPGVRPRLRRSPVLSTDALLRDPALPWGSRTITPILAFELVEALERRHPQRIVEVGSGISTVVLARYAAATGASLVSLEHDRRFAARTLALLSRFGLERAVDLRVAPLRQRRCPDGHLHPWYDVRLNGTFDFGLLDAPPLRQGRGAVLFALREVLEPDFELWLNDATRRHERVCLAGWLRHMPFTSEVGPIDSRGLAILRPAGAEPSGDGPGAVPGLGIGLLATGPPAVLREGLERVVAAAPRLLSDAPVVAVVDGREPSLADYLRGLRFVDRCVVDARFEPATAIGRLVTEASAASSVDAILVLPPGWVPCTVHNDWAARSMAALARNPALQRVRLRHLGDELRSPGPEELEPVIERAARDLIADARDPLETHPGPGAFRRIDAVPAP
jgi:glycosyltransferase involved in cell wall biosynthesis